jgi:hypothetical protein
MKFPLLFAITLFWLSSLTACQEREIGRSTSQEIVITNFARPTTFTLSPARPSSTTGVSVRIDGTISENVNLTVFRFDTSGKPIPLQSVDLEAGTYQGRGFSFDHYQSEDLKLTVTPSKSTTGNLTIVWQLM